MLGVVCAHERFPESGFDDGGEKTGETRPAPKYIAFPISGAEAIFGGT